MEMHHVTSAAEAPHVMSSVCHLKPGIEDMYNDEAFSIGQGLYSTIEFLCWHLPYE